jgi:mono/diheme cytochrome c family protein
VRRSRVVIAALPLLCTSGCATGGDRRGGLDRAPAAAAVPRLPPADSATLRAGEKLFARHCASCHGDDARGRSAPSLLTDRVKRARPGDLFWVLTNGDLPAGMPAWARLPAARRWQIVAYLGSLSGDANLHFGASAASAETTSPAVIRSSHRVSSPRWAARSKPK